MVTHSKDNGGKVMKVAVKNGVADFTRIEQRFIKERKVKIRTVSTTGSWSNAVNVTLTS